MNDTLVRQVIIKVSAAFFFLGAVFFVPAGTFRFWQAWIYLGLLFGSMLLIMAYLLRHDPALLERRLKSGEKEEPQKLIIKIGSLVYFLLFLIPGLDFRYGWSSVPIAVVAAADILFVIGYYIFFLTLRENSYASRIIEVEEEQKVISTGPYAVVRHPMYSAMVLMLGLTPLCLGSYWGMTASLVPMLAILALRILNEERVLKENLPGYEEYVEKVKYRLVPGIW